MITYKLLDKSEKQLWLPRLFDLYYTNMNTIAPSGLSFYEDRSLWLGAVSPALDKGPRQILLCCKDGELAGYVQYYTLDDLLMIEEVQLTADFLSSTVFLSMVRALIRLLPEGIRYVEAYADIRNHRSIQLMQRLGMELVPEPESSPFVHFRGVAEKVREKLTRT